MTDRNTVKIRKLEPDEVKLHRDLALRALQDSPDSFGETLDEARARPWSYWEQLTQSVTDPNRHVMFLACEGEDVCGSTYGLLDRERSDTGRVGGMWVDPSWQRRGIGWSLLQAVFDWARRCGLSRLELWAPAHIPAAISLYRRAGFEKTGHRRPLPSNSSLEIIEMDCEL